MEPWKAARDSSGCCSRVEDHSYRAMIGPELLRGVETGFKTAVHPPLRRGRTSVSNHSSSTWCRKVFERQGEITPSCGEPSVVWRRRPSSRTPALHTACMSQRLRWVLDIDIVKYFTRIFETFLTSESRMV